MNKQPYFLENNRKMSYGLVIICILTIIINFYFLFSYVSPYASTWDQVDFALAINRFDLLAMQPHFPGYPYFILGGTIFHFIIDNNAKALATFNAVFLLFSSIPIYFLFRNYTNKVLSLVGVTILLSSSYLLVIASQPMSEGSAIAILWWYLWSIEFVKKSKRFLSHFIPLCLFSILLGIRLSYFPFGIGILLLWWIQRKKLGFLKIGILAISAIIFQLVWISALVISEGSISSFWKLAQAFTNGHFEDWGGAITASHDSFLSRIFKLVLNDIFWVGICTQSFWLLFFWLALFVLACFYFVNFKPRLDNWLFIQAGIYFVWVLLGQNVDKPRHILPFIGILLFYVIVTVIKSNRSFVVFIIILTSLIQLAISYSYLKEQVTTPPAVYQMAQYLQEYDENVVLYTWEETRILQYLKAPFIHKRIYTYDYFLQDKLNYQHATIILTDHVVKGFEMQGINLKNHLKKIAEFQTNEIFDPVYNRIILYKYVE